MEYSNHYSVPPTATPPSPCLICCFINHSAVKINSGLTAACLYRCDLLLSLFYSVLYSVRGVALAMASLPCTVGMYRQGNLNEAGRSICFVFCILYHVQSIVSNRFMPGGLSYADVCLKVESQWERNPTLRISTTWVHDTNDLPQG